MSSRSRAAACCAAASISFSALAQAQAPPRFVAPRLLERVEARYPEEARLSGLTGTVVVRIVVGTDGRVISAEVVQGAGHGFDEAALEAARKLRFEPATREGRPVAVQLDYEVRFELPEAPAPALRDTVRPAPRSSPEPVFESDVEADRPLTAASARTVRDFLLRPRFTPEDVLRVVPGLVLAQHQGGGKADQIFLRGFDADHGTDVSVNLDGVPVNMPSHAHGQGYADLHFLIPEAIERIEITKGPYFAEYGDFDTAGAVNLMTRDRFESSQVSATTGLFPTLSGSRDDGTSRRFLGYRFLGVASPLTGDFQPSFAAEVYGTGGPFLHSEKLQRYNLFAKATWRVAPETTLSLLATAYASSWIGSGQIPARLVDAGLLDRYGAIDPTEGGDTQRQQAILAFVTHPDARSTFKASLSAIRYGLTLFNDFTFQAVDPVHGDEIEQDDQRTTVFASFRYDRLDRAGSLAFLTTLGAQFRAADVAASLWKVERRVRLPGCAGVPNPCVSTQDRQSDAAAFVQEDFRPARWLRVVLGLRDDLFEFDVRSQLPSGAIDPAPRVVGMEARAEVQVQVQLLDGREHHARLRRDDAALDGGRQRIGMGGIDRSRRQLRAHVELEQVVAQAEDHSKPARGAEVLLHERGGVGLPVLRAHARVGHARAAGQPHAALDLPQVGGDVVGAELGAQGGEEGEASGAVEAIVAEAGEHRGALVVLLDLVPVHRIHCLEGEVVEQRQPVADGRERRLEGGAGVRVGDEGEDCLLALRVAALGGVDRSVAVEQARVHQPRRDLPRADPAGRVGGGEQREGGPRRHAPGRLGEQVVPLQLLRVEEGPAGAVDLGREIRLEVARERTGDAEEAVPEEPAGGSVVAAAAQGREQAGRRAHLRALEAVARDQVHRARGIEVPVFGEVRALGDLDALDRLGDEEVQVGVALAVRVRGHVHRHSVEVHAHVGPVVGVEAAQEDLVGLPTALVLREDQPGHDAQDVLGREARPQQEVAVAHRACARGSERAVRLDVGLENRLRRRPRRRADRVAQRRRRRIRQLEADLVVELDRHRPSLPRGGLEAQLARGLQRRLVESVSRALAHLSGDDPPVGSHHDPHHHRPGQAREARLLGVPGFDPLQQPRGDETGRRLRLRER